VIGDLFRGTIEFKLSGERPSDEDMERIATRMQEIVRADQQMAQVEASMNELSISSSSTWSAPHHQQTGTMIVPSIFHTKFNSSKLIWMLNFTVEAPAGSCSLRRRCPLSYSRHRIASWKIRCKWQEGIG
jgi:hypothetical protein